MTEPSSKRRTGSGTPELLTRILGRLASSAPVLPTVVLGRLGALAASTGDWPSAQRFASAALDRAPCGPAAARLSIRCAREAGDPKGASQQIEAFRARCPDAPSSIALESVRTAYALGDDRRAARDVADGLKADPADADRALLQLWQAHLGGDSERIAAGLREALQRRKARRRTFARPALQDMALFAEAEGDWRAARELWACVIERAPHDRSALAAFHALGARHLPLDEFRTELEDWLARGEPWARVAQRMAVFLAYYEDRDWRRTCQLARPGGKRRPERPVLVHAALAHARLGEAEPAESRLAEAERGSWPNSELSIARAQVRRLLGDSTGQVQSINELLRQQGLLELRPGAAGLRLPPGLVSTPSPIEKGPLVSVIMPIYKRQPMLDMAIRSVLDQSYLNTEVWLVDDASPDDTRDHLSGWAESDPRVRVLSMPRNGGPYLAKNAAMAACSGRFIAFADSDDWNHPQRLARQVARLEEDPGAGGLCVRYVRVDQEGNIVFRCTAVKTAWQSLMIRRETIDTVGYFDALRAGADTEYIERIKAVFTPSGLLVDQAILLIAAHHNTSLTGGGRLAMDWRPVSGARQQNHLAFRRWHRQCLARGITPYLTHPLTERAFHAPPELIVDHGHAFYPGNTEIKEG